MSGDWKIESWEDVVVLKYGKAIRGYKEADGQFPVYGSNGRVGTTDDPIFKGPGVILGRKGAYRGIEFCKTNFSVIDTAYSVEPIRTMNKRWLYFAVQFHKLGHIDDGSPIPSTTRAAVYARDLMVPSVAEQDEIAKALGSLDDKIDLNRQMNTTLEAMAQAIFKDWFVDFGPTRRKADGETDPVKILGGLIPDSAKAQKVVTPFPDTFDDNGLPVSWNTNSFIDFIDIVGGGTPKTSNGEYWSGDIPWFSVKDTPGGSDCFVFATEKMITPAGLKGSSAKLIEKGTTIISARGTVGNLAIAGRDMTFNQSCYALKPKDSDAIYFTFLAAQTVVQRLKDMAHGSVFSTITRATFESVVFPNIPLHLIEQFESICSPLFEKIRANVEENQTLAEARDYLLPKLMSGEVRVGDATPAAATETANVVGLDKDLFGRKHLPADQATERDAVMVAAIINLFDSNGHVVGNFRYQKGVYFLKRFLDLPQATTTKQAAGPYDGALRYRGGHKVAQDRRYIREGFVDGKTGNKPGSKISDAIAKINKFELREGLAWVEKNLRYKNNDELECLATVDFAMNELRTRGSAITVDAIIQDIHRDDVWRPKLSKTHFRKDKIREAMNELNKLFGTV